MAVVGEPHGGEVAPAKLAEDAVAVVVELVADRHWVVATCTRRCVGGREYGLFLTLSLVGTGCHTSGAFAQTWLPPFTSRRRSHHEGI